MAHIEDMFCKPASMLPVSGGTVQFFAAGINTEKDSDYTILRTSVDGQTEEYPANRGKVYPSYRRSNLDRDLPVFHFTLTGVKSGDRLVIQKWKRDFSGEAVLATGGTPTNVWLMKHAPDNVRRQNLLSLDVPVEPVPVSPRKMSAQPRGLAIHVTAGESGARDVVKNTWGTTGVSAHFIIERNGRLVQCVALTLCGEAQGDRGVKADANFHWLSVEFVCGMNNWGTDGFLTTSQILAGNRLFTQLAQRFGFPPRLAEPLITDGGQYGQIAQALARANGLAGVRTREEAIMSQGLSCHRWLGAGHACPGIIGLRIMPDILNTSRLVASDVDMEL